MKTIHVIQRKAAVDLGLKRYFTGKPCKRGHISERHTSSGECVSCSSDRASSDHYRRVKKEWNSKNALKLSVQNKEWKRKNRDKVRAANQKWVDKNPDYQKEHYQKNKNKYKKYAENNSQAIKERMKKWREDNKDRLSGYEKEYYSKNAEKKREYARKWREANPEKVRQQRIERSEKRKEYCARYMRERRARDPLYAVSCRIRARITSVFKYQGFRKSEKTEKILGCDWDTLKSHIERQFIKGMTWENRSEWHIDHIVPLASAKTEEDLIALNHYTNLRPLWAEDNLSKGAKMEFLI